ncbi:MAG: Rha family transcriptional regulator [Sphingomonas sp.]|nr:Rha family transcriptional regulator [Sphingomonas sp.]MDX3885580.1 Rha family transcriptional regulator [Sphingomonas sp.]
MNPVVRIMEDRVVADSRDVAEAFGKRHADVLRDIDNLISMSADCERNFAFTTYAIVSGRGGTRHARCANLDRTGFMLLVMGFTGAKALAAKMAWIRAFDQMEATLSGLAAANDAEAPPLFMETPAEIERVRAVILACRQAGRIYGRDAERAIWEMAGLPRPATANDATGAALAYLPPDVAEWLRARTEADPAARTGTMALYEDFERFCAGAAMPVMSVKAFAQVLQRAGFHGLKSNGMWRIGIRLRGEAV